ncbi:hypothetical protein [Peredibacter starrii]|uniref:Uncharacterized protein n=1 Tax=Peredibacter starrii TaxID=28202 RepID=A0AAX4HT09_9BACT|nr:hypothetical protein [Peredibacter starrii]WPU66520.1 hypothetical protein SOO65_07160 [Peredibacter starrii]
MKELIFNTVLIERIHLAFTRSWLGFILVSSLLLFLIMSLSMNLAFYFWKVDYIPYHEKTFVNFFSDLISLRNDLLILSITCLYLIWGFVRLFLDPIFKVFMLPFETIWSFFGNVHGTHGHSDHDPYDWFDVIQMRVFEWRGKRFIISTGEAMCAISLLFWSILYFIIQSYFSWWSILLIFAASSFYWLAVNNLRYVFYDDLPESNVEKINKRKDHKFDRGLIYSLSTIVLVLLAFIISLKTRSSFHSYFSSKTRVEVCTVEKCFYGNYLQTTSYGHLILKDGLAVAISGENLKHITFY